MTYVRDISSNDANAPTTEEQLFGVEVEYEETEELPSSAWQFRNGWSTVEDHSLRNGGIEFVSKPMTLRRIGRSFSALCLVAGNSRWQATARTGIHVHADMRNRTLEELAGIIAAYAAFEPLLFALAGHNRDQCIYCVPWYAAPDQASAARSYALGNIHPTTRLVKYSALYLEPIRTFGTIEFRHAPTWLKPKPMRRWLCAINRLITWGQKQTPMSVMEACMTNPNTLVREVFGWTMRNMPDPEGIMDRADSLAVVDETLPRIYEVKGWDWQNGVASGDALMYHIRAAEQGVMPGAMSVGAFDATRDEFGEPEEYEEDEDDYEREDY